MIRYVKPWFSFRTTSSNFVDVVQYIDNINEMLAKKEVTPAVVAQKMKELISDLEKRWASEWDNNPELKALFDNFKGVKDLAKSISIADKQYPSRKKSSVKYESKMTSIDKVELQKLRRIQNFVEFLYSQGTVTEDEWNELQEEIDRNDANKEK